VISNEAAYNELCCYTLAHGDLSFIHQHVVDSFAAQNADENTKPIKLTFALIGLYLHVENTFQAERSSEHISFLPREKDRGRLSAT